MEMEVEMALFPLVVVDAGGGSDAMSMQLWRAERTDDRMM